ncbi:hypothetical protein PHPALM_29004, partial [Phytophthora palmivora]
MLRLIGVFYITVALLAPTTQAGYVDLYKDKDYKHKLSRIDDVEVDYCYSFACDALDNTITSARWGDLPEKKANGDDVMISFFIDRDCREHDIWWRTKTQSDSDLYFPSNFKLDGINDVVSSFIVWKTKKVKGTWLICTTESGTKNAENETVIEVMGTAKTVVFPHIPRLKVKQFLHPAKPAPRRHSICEDCDGTSPEDVTAFVRFERQHRHQLLPIYDDLQLRIALRILPVRSRFWFLAQQVPDIQPYPHPSYNNIETTNTSSWNAKSLRHCGLRYGEIGISSFQCNHFCFKDIDSESHPTTLTNIYTTFGANYPSFLLFLFHTNTIAMSLILYVVLVIMTINTATADDFSGEIKFYRDINYRYNLALFSFTKSNRCYNLACGDYNDAVSSVKWSGLPSTASYDGDSNAKVIFYVSTGCTGRSKGYSTSLPGVKSFVDEGINDAISSFMVIQTSKEVENG